MTTIVAVETPAGVIFGSDSQATLGLQKSVMEASKVLYRGEYTIGVAGRALLMQILRYAPLPSVELEDVDEHMTTVFGPALRSIEEKAGLKPHESILLVAVRGRVYLVVGDGTFLRDTNGVYAIGSGAEFALGALRDVPNPGVADVERALKVAASHDIGTSGPFKVSVVR